ncbi:hypothetical protein PG990_005814 [Apiospora arundinis]
MLLDKEVIGSSVQSNWSSTTELFLQKPFLNISESKVPRSYHSKEDH